MHDPVHPRLQLSLGAVAELAGEVPGRDGLRAFEGVARDSGLPVLVILHQAPPMGPAPAALRDRITELRALEHDVLDLPLASGSVDDSAWVVEMVSKFPAASDRLGSGPLTIPHGVSAIRDLARALAGMHRRGLAHGAIDSETVRVTPTGARLGGMGRSLRGSTQEDLDALGLMAWSILSGTGFHAGSPRLSARRRGVPAELDALCTAWVTQDSSERPRRAETILEVLDGMPTRRAHPSGWIVDLSTHDGRPGPRPRQRVAWLLVGAVALMLMVLLALWG